MFDTSVILNLHYFKRDSYISVISVSYTHLDGMLITDHDTYKGYRHWKYQMKGQVHEDLVGLKRCVEETGAKESMK